MEQILGILVLVIVIGGSIFGALLFAIGKDVAFLVKHRGEGESKEKDATYTSISCLAALFIILALLLFDC